MWDLCVSWLADCFKIPPKAISYLNGNKLRKLVSTIELLKLPLPISKQQEQLNSLINTIGK